MGKASRPDLGPTNHSIQILPWFFPRGKKTDRKVNHSPLSSTEFIMSGAVPLLPYTPSWRGREKLSIDLQQKYIFLELERIKFCVFF